MTMVDDAPQPTPETKPRRPKVVWVFAALAFVFLLVGLAGGSYQGKLSDVQKNDNSAFSPGSADSTKVTNAAGRFSSTQTIPGFIVYQRTGGLTAADKSKITRDGQAFRSMAHVATDQVGQPQFSSSGDVAAISVPLVGKANGVSRTGPELVDTEKAVISAAEQNTPDGLVVHSAGAGGILVAFIDAFSGIDGSLLFAAGIVVIVILLFIYRSPVLWFFPLFSSVLAWAAHR